MIKRTNYLLTIKLLFILLFLAGCENSLREEFKFTDSKKADLDKISALAQEARQYCQNRNLSTDYFILIDLSMHSGLKRFFVWDFNNDEIIESYLVSHGCCDSPWGMDLTKTMAGVSNINGSHCSSIGKYIIGERGYSNWGIHIKYLLHGQEPTNNNATKRDIVFHSWERVSNAETYPSGTPEGWGCPAISNSAMQAMDQRLRNTDKKVLMWIVN